MARVKIEPEEDRSTTPFDIFVNRGDKSMRGWTEGLTPEQARDMLKSLIAARIPGETVEIPIEVLNAYHDMHWVFPGVVCSVDNFKGRLEAYLEYFEECPDLEEDAFWKVTVSRGKREFIGRVSVECFVTDIVATLTKLTEVIYTL